MSKHKADVKVPITVLKDLIVEPARKWREEYEAVANDPWWESNGLACPSARRDSQWLALARKANLGEYLPFVDSITDLFALIRSGYPVTEDNRKNLPPKKKRPPRKPRPKWDEDTHQLLYDGKVVRKIKNWKRAVNPCKVLREFQTLKWKKSVGCPRNTDPREIVRTLNRGLSCIKFRRDGSGDGIEWYLDEVQ